MFLSKSAVKAVNIFKAIGIFLLCITALLFSKECSKGAENGIGLCLSTLVPSLFPFMVLASYITDSGLAEKIGRHLSWLTKPLFGLDGCFASAIKKVRQVKVSVNGQVCFWCVRDRGFL